jgi:beta-mannosidase
VLWLTDVVPGAGWGVLDHCGNPKAAFHHLCRALAPVAAWTTDEGLSGVAIHVANDRPLQLEAVLRVSLYRDLELSVEEVSRPLRLDAHSAWEGNVEELLGRFVDASWAYRFGSPGHDLIAVSLESPGADGVELLAQSFRRAPGRPPEPLTHDRLGLTATVRSDREGAALLTVSSRRFAYGVRVETPGFVAEHDAFSVEPGHRRRVRLRPVAGSATPVGGHLTALNLDGRVRIEREHE